MAADAPQAAPGQAPNVATVISRERDRLQAELAEQQRLLANHKRAAALSHQALAHQCDDLRRERDAARQEAAGLRAERAGLISQALEREEELDKGRQEAAALRASARDDATVIEGLTAEREHYRQQAAGLRQELAGRDDALREAWMRGHEAAQATEVDLIALMADFTRFRATLEDIRDNGHRHGHGWFQSRARAALEGAGPDAPQFAPHQLLSARHDTPDMTGPVTGFEPLEGAGTGGGDGQLPRVASVVIEEDTRDTWADEDLSRYDESRQEEP